MLAFAGFLLVLALSPWTLFPVVTSLLSPRRRTVANGAANGDTVSLVSICIPAHNEGAELRQKLANTLETATGPWRREIIVCDDGSTDETAAIVADFADRGVVLVQHVHCLGKPTALASLTAQANGDVVLFTDASASMAPDVPMLLVAALQEPGVGMATARYRLRGADGAHAERRSFEVDAQLRRIADKHGVLLGGSGAAMAMWRRHAQPLPKDTIHDDYALAMRAFAAGEDVRYVNAAVVEDSAADHATTYRRYRRIAAGNVQLVARAPLLNVRIAVPLLLQKMPKTLAPWLVALASVCIALAMPRLAGVALLAMSPLVVAQRRGVLHLVRIAVALMKGLIVGLRGTFDIRWRLPTAPSAPPATTASSAPASTLPAVPGSVLAAKRAFDVVVAGTALVLLSPLMAFLAALIKADSRGPIFYLQERLRFDNDGQAQTFAMFKLRTMRTDAEADGRARWAQKDDPRVTRIGRFLRVSRLDEVPQLVNVLRGEMTIVGPRPERPSFVEQLRTVLPSYDERLRRVKPGITGWAQVNCEYDASIDSVRQKVLYDLAYVAHLYRFSSWARIEANTVFRTFGVMVTGRGAR